MKKILLIILISFFLIVPLSSKAAYDSYTEGKGLVPCGNDSATPCTICHFIIGIHGLLSFGFKVLIIVATVALVFAGIMYTVSTGNSGAMESAKEFIKSVLIGVAIMLLAWLIINTVMTILATKSDLGIGKTSWTSYSCD